MKPKSTFFQILVCSAVVFAFYDALLAKEPLYDGLGSYSRKITKDSAEAQRYFDQGLGFLHGFNHRAAIRAFQQAAELDPKCAMAHWGVALACGPHINSMAVPTPAAELAWKELELAQKNAGNASPVERALIDALAKRYANPQPKDRSGLDRAYADAMREVWEKYPKDPDVGALLAEAMMNLRPWDQWTPAGKPQPGTDGHHCHSGRGVKTQPEPSIGESSLHPRSGSIAKSGTRDCRCGAASQFTARPRPQRAYAVAYRHSHRPVAEGRGNKCKGSGSRSAAPENFRATQRFFERLRGA
jgi:hypothetical protein